MPTLSANSQDSVQPLMALRLLPAINRGAWLEEAMKRAIKDGGLTIDDIGYVNAHGTSTRLNDLSESRAIASLFKEKAGDVLVNSTKSMIGHTIAAAGAIEAAVTAMSISRGIFHPTRNLECRDEGCELNYCPGKAVKTICRGCYFQFVRILRLQQLSHLQEVQ